MGKSKSEAQANARETCDIVNNLSRRVSNLEDFLRMVDDEKQLYVGVSLAGEIDGIEFPKSQQKALVACVVAELGELNNKILKIRGVALGLT